MANEQHRAQRIESEFQKLLAELKKQDEELEALSDRFGTVADGNASSVDPELARLFPEPEPVECPRQDLGVRAIELRGLVVRG